MNFTYQKVVSLLLFLSIVFSCSKNEESTKSVLENVSKIDIIQKCTDCGTDDSMFYFYAGMNASFSSLKKSAIEFEKIEEELSKNNPLKIVYNDEMKIVKIVPLSNQELKAYVKKRSKIKRSKEFTLPVFNEKNTAKRFIRGFRKASIDRLATMFSNVSDYEYINFDYAKDGCYARAHEMTRVIKKWYPHFQYKVYKIWAYSSTTSLRTKSSNGCCLTWRYHVAPVLRCSTDLKWYVIDPSLSSKPLSVDEWSNMISSCDNNKGAKPVLKYTPRDVYYRDKNNHIRLFDKLYSKTNCVLKHYARVKKIYNDCERGISPSCN